MAIELIVAFLSTLEKSSYRRKQWSKKHPATIDDFCASEAENHGIYDFFAFGSKNHSIHSVFLPRAEQKHLHLRSFHLVARCRFYMQKQ